MSLEEDATKVISMELKNLTQIEDKVVFAVCGGRSVAKIFDLLIKEDIDWNKIHFFMVDERRVSIDDEESNYKLLQDHLVSKVNIPLENIHPYHYDKDISEYENELKSIKERFDIVLLSSGEDGHLAGIYPNHHTVNNNGEYFMVFDDSPKLPPKRMSATRKLIERSRIAFLLFNGDGKKDAYDKYNDDDVFFTDCPSKIVQSCTKTYIMSSVK